MNRFSKMTAAIAFWSDIALLITAVFIVIFQKTCLAYYFHENEPYAHIFIMPWRELIQYTLTAVIIGLYLFIGKKNPKTATLLIFYFYMHITALLTSPLPNIFISMYGARTYGIDYLTVSNTLASLFGLVSFPFVLLSNSLFLLSAGSSIAYCKDAPATEEQVKSASSKRKNSLVCLSALAGLFGADRFYAGRKGLGTLKALCGLLLIAGLISQYFFFQECMFLFISVSLFKIAGIVFIFAVVIWNWIDFIFAATGNMKDEEKKKIQI